MTDRRLGQGERGAVVIEFTLVLVVLLTWVFAIIAFSIGIGIYSTMAQAARDGARFAIVRGSSPDNVLGPATENQVRDYVRGQAGVFGTATQVTTSWSPNKDPGSVVQVSVSFVFQPQLAFLPVDPITITSTSRMVITY